MPGLRRPAWVRGGMPGRECCAGPAGRCRGVGRGGHGAGAAGSLTCCWPVDALVRRADEPGRSVRGWVRRCRAQAQVLRAGFTGLLVAVDSDPLLPCPAGPGWGTRSPRSWPRQCSRWGGAQAEEPGCTAAQVVRVLRAQSGWAPSECTPTSVGRRTARSRARTKTATTARLGRWFPVA